MKVREKIINSIGQMYERELNRLYGQIRILERIKSSPTRKKAVSIERIRELTFSSKTSWSDAVMENRADRR